MKPIAEASYMPDRDTAAKFAWEITKYRFFSAPSLILDAVLVITITALGAWNEYIDSFFMLAAIIFPGIAIVLIPPVLGYFVQRRQALRMQELTGTVNYQFFDRHFTRHTEKTEQKMDYDLIERYQRTPNGCLIKLVNRQLLFIPTSAVTDHVEAAIRTKLPAPAKLLKNKKPWLAAILNALLFGLGYLYAGQKKLFAIILLIADGLALLSLVAYQTLSFGDWRQDLSYVLIAIALAVDGFNVARASNKLNATRSEFDTGVPADDPEVALPKSPHRKLPWLAALLNLVPGLGYLYLGTRRVFAIILLAYVGGRITLPYLFPSYKLWLSHSPNLPLLTPISGLFFVAFATDAYLLTRHINRMRTAKMPGHKSVRSTEA